ncbi:hypothetical protein COL922a_014484, partial [Colletotrichum nupharicola]
QFTGPDSIHDTLYPIVGGNARLDKGDPLIRSDMPNELISRALVADDGENVSSGV